MSPPLTVPNEVWTMLTGEVIPPMRVIAAFQPPEFSEQLAREGLRVLEIEDHGDGTGTMTIGPDEEDEDEDEDDSPLLGF
jgi:hypothetical protein